MPPHGNSHKTAAFLVGINETTFCRWMEQNKNFAYAVREAEQQAIADNVNALYRTATRREVVRVKTIEDVDGNIIKTETTKTFEQDTQVALAFLERKDPDNWRLKNEMPVVGPVTVNVDAALLKVYGNPAALASPPDPVEIEGEIVQEEGTEEETD